MGICCAKKQLKDPVLQRKDNNEQQKNMNQDDLNKLYTKILEPLKLSTIKMINDNTNQLDHYYRTSETSATNLSALKPQIKKIQAEMKLLYMQLPVQLTNSIFVCQALSHQNFFKALISGSDNTPYANGLFLYDIYLPDNYPNECPKMQLITTGGNSIRFNPNLYQNGYVCLSLLGT